MSMSFQRLVEMPTVFRVKSSRSPEGFFIEFKRDKEGKVTHFIQHTRVGPLPAEEYRVYHPLMMSQNADWSEHNIIPIEPEIKKVSPRKR